jgi:ion channel
MSPGTLLKDLGTAGGTGEAGPGGTGRPVRRQRFGLLLLVLMTTYVLSAFVQGRWVTGTQIGLFGWVTALALRTGELKRGTARLMASAAIGGSVIAITLAVTHSSDAVGGVANLWAATMLLLAVVLIVRQVIGLPEVTMQSICGAVSGYLILGLMFAAIYAAIDHFSGGSFFAPGQRDNGLKTFQYFSFTTLTTLGYGDYTPVQSGGQAVAVMEALLGQVFLATLVARLVSAFRSPVRREPAAAPRSAPGHQARVGRPASPGYPPGPGHPAGPGHLAGPGHPAGPDHPASPPRAAGPSSGARLSPRARARQARRSRPRLPRPGVPRRRLAGGAGATTRKA